MNHRGLGGEALSDDALLARLIDRLGRSRCVEAELVALIAEVDARRLYLREACPSMHAYATERLHLSDAEAYLRIAVGRVSRRFPIVLDMLADGRLHLSGIARLAPHLRDGDGSAVLARAAHRSKREIDILVAELSPRPDAPSRIRRLPDPVSSRDRSMTEMGTLLPDGVVSGGAAGAVSPGDVLEEGVSHGGSGPGSTVGAVCGPESNDGAAPHDGVGGAGPRGRELGRTVAAVVAPTAPGRFKVQFTAGDELHAKLVRAQELLRHQVPDGDLAVIVDRAMTLLVRELERARFAATSSPRKSVDQVDPTPSSRAIPAPIRRAVWLRDGGQCTFRGPRGERCSSRERVEFHHVIPFALGGEHSASNVRLLCKRHNAYQADLDFGAECIAAHRRRAASGSVRSGASAMTGVSTASNTMGAAGVPGCRGRDSTTMRAAGGVAARDGDVAAPS